MSLMKRISLIFRSKANKALDRAEDPRETLDYSYQRQLEMLTKVRRGVADVATSRKRVELQINQLQTQALVQRAKAGELRMYLGSWGSYSINDVSAILPNFFDGGADDYARDPDVQKWLIEAGSSNDAEVRKKAYSAAIQRISFGTSVPGPRTSRSISPRFTVSSHTLERSTLGAAGPSFASPRMPPSTTTPAMTPSTICLRRFLTFRSERWISMITRQATRVPWCQRSASC